MNKIFGLLLILLPFGTWGQVNLSNGLVLYLPFNGNAMDASGNGNNGIVNGATLTTDQAGNPNSAYSFNGISDFIKVSHHNSLNSPTNELTLCIKAKFDTFNSQPCFGNMLFSKGVSFLNLLASPNSFYAASCVHPYTTSNVRFESEVYGNAGTSSNFLNGSSINLNQWYCLVLTATADTVKLYANGILQHSFASGLATSNSDSILIGKYLSSQYPFFFGGKLDEIRLYNRIINSNEISAYCSVLSCDTLANFLSTVNCNVVNYVDSSFSNCVTITGWQWDFGDGSPISTVQNPVHTYATAGTYNVKLKIYNAAVLLDSVIKSVTVFQPPVVNAGKDTSICKGTLIQLQGSATINADSFKWINNTVGLSSTNILNPTATVNTTTTYTLVGFNKATGCSDTDQILVTVFANNLNIIRSPLANRYCPGDTVNLNVTPNYLSYTWGPSSTLTSTTTNSTKAFGSTSTTYWVSVLDTNGCTLIDSQIINRFTKPNASVGHSVVTCKQVQFSTAITGGNVTSINWNFGDASTGTGTAPIHTYAADGTYYITATINYGFGCQITLNDTVILLTDFIADAGNDTVICPGTFLQLHATGGGSYQWTGIITGLNNTTIANPIASPVVTTTYTVLITNINGCVKSDQVEVAVFDDQLYIGGDDTVCEGMSSRLDINNTSASYSTILWTPTTIMSNPTGMSTDATPTTSTKVLVEALSTNGCLVKDSIYITVLPVPDISVWYDGTNVCKNTPLQLHAKGGLSYFWTPNTYINNPFIADPIYNAPSSGSISVMVHTYCTDTTVLLDLPAINDALEPYAYTPDTIVGCFNANVNLIGVGGTSYEWSPRNEVENPTAAKTIGYVNNSKTFYVDITDMYSCHTLDTVNVILDNKYLRFQMPNAITYGSGDQNAIFKVLPNFNFNLKDLSIYNRWGNRVFQTNNISQGWDGTYKGEASEQGNYVWVIQGTTPCGDFQETGTVLLIK